VAIAPLQTTPAMPFLQDFMSTNGPFDDHTSLDVPNDAGDLSVARRPFPN
jgi:hypothetical protein